MLEKNLKIAREKAGLSQAELGQKVGVNQCMISDYERGFKTPSVPTLKRIADELGWSVDELLAG